MLKHNLHDRVRRIAHGHLVRRAESGSQPRWAESVADDEHADRQAAVGVVGVAAAVLASQLFLEAVDPIHRGQVPGPPHVVDELVADSLSTSGSM